jgi:hypothetical protein
MLIVGPPPPPGTWCVGGALTPGPGMTTGGSLGPASPYVSGPGSAPSLGDSSEVLSPLAGACGSPGLFSSRPAMPSAGGFSDVLSPRGAAGGSKVGPPPPGTPAAGAFFDVLLPRGGTFCPFGPKRFRPSPEDCCSCSKSGGFPDINPASTAIAAILALRATATIELITSSLFSMSSLEFTLLIRSLALMTLSTILFLARTTASYESLNSLTQAVSSFFSVSNSEISASSTPRAAPAAPPDHIPTPSNI